MKKFWVWLLFLLIFITHSHAQTGTRYLVRFKNKASSPFSFSNPSAYLSQKSIDRRTRYAVPLDSTDLPVNPSYINAVQSAGAVTILNVSKWLNQVSIQTTDAAALIAINNLPYVYSVAPIASKMANNGVDEKNKKLNVVSNEAVGSSVLNTAADFYNYGSSYAQVHIHNAEFLHNIGLRGQAMTIGMLDAGYLNYQTVSSLDSIRSNGQIKDTWDFVSREASVNEDHSHGMQCLSVIAANIPGTFVGTAPKANFYLYRSEDAATEYPIEEHNWACAAERVDSAGGDVISSSLGYTKFDDPAFNHTYADMDGNTTMSAIAADLAAKKGILVFIAAGNEGSNSWHYISTPADADSVVTVGAVNTNGIPAGFSSYGPSSDGQIKPDVASVGAGTIVQFGNNTIGANNGTSFACPNIAGIGTCIWQGFQEFNNMKIVNALRQSGSIASAPDDRIGYGIPDAKKAVMILLKEFSAASASTADCRTTINWTSKDVSLMQYQIERKLPGETVFTVVGQKQGTGNIFGNRTYNHVDQLPNGQTGNILYRIKQIIDTASASLTADYIDSVSVQINIPCVAQEGTEITVIPNPVQNDLTLRLYSSANIQNLQINIIDVLGQVVARKKTTATAGTNNINFTTSHFASGKYFITVYDNGKLLGTREFIKL